MTAQSLAILVIDENRIRASIIEEGLRENGHDNVTVVHDIAGIARTIAEINPDVIVIELGDGFIGHYGVDDFLLDAEFSHFTCADVVAATDLAGAWAADQLFTNRYHRPISVMVGPVTDNGVGSDYIIETLGTPAHNAIQDPHGLVGSVIKPFMAWNDKHLPKVKELVA